MRYGSVCSGIEAATVAWHPLGWKPAFFSEIEPFPSAVLAHHYPEVKNYGDFTKLIEPAHPVHAEPPIDLLVGGTPCQAFSVAGLRQGLADPRGGLTLEFLRLARALRPRWVVWENVPGVLSQDGGRAFGAFLGGLEDLGYGWAYRVLDAQYTRVDGYPGAVPQRRRRVFVVGHSGGDFARAAAVLLEPEGVRGNPPTRRPKGQGSAADATPSVAGAIDRECGGGKLTHQPAANGHLLGCYWDGGQVTQTLDAVLYKAQTMPEKNRFPAVVTPVAFDARQSDTLVYGDKTGPLDTDGHTIGVCVTGDRTHALTTRSAAEEDGTGRGNPIVNAGMAVRRLTPVECERLQGFPDDYTRIAWKKKSAEECPDSGRYKALGNSMAVNCMRWIGRRIELVEAS